MMCRSVTPEMTTLRSGGRGKIQGQEEIPFLKVESSPMEEMGQHS